MNIPKITLLSTEDCSLCISARKTVQEVSENTGAELEELNITQTPELHKLYATQVPVVLVDGKPHDFWTINEDRLTQAIRSKN